MIKTLARSIREYKKPAILTPLLVTIEVILECIIPFSIANLVNQMQAGCGMDVIVKYGIQLVITAILSLIFGVAAGNTCATASTGFARNLRKDMFYHIQDYSFENIDKFSVSSLVTRMTTDVVNVQMSFMMIIRVAIRGPLMLIFSFIMGFAMGGRLAMIFLVTIPLLSIGMVLIIRAATPIFRRVFRKYDALNDSVQENVQAMRVPSAVEDSYQFLGGDPNEYYEQDPSLNTLNASVNSYTYQDYCTAKLGGHRDLEEDGICDECGYEMS